MSSKNKLVIANWKMNPETEDEAIKIASGILMKVKKQKNTKLVVCPPFVFLNKVADIILKSKNIFLGAQDVFLGDGVAHTGEVSPEMVKSVGVKYVIVGHSEKRDSGDTDLIVENKLLGVLNIGLKAVLCIGEKERNEHGQHFGDLEAQIKNAVGRMPKKMIKNLIIAYEPVWAIGKSEKEAMKPDELLETVIFIRKVIGDVLKIKDPHKIPVLYGGSVTKGNAPELIEGGRIDGLLVGRESLKVDDFADLIKEISA